MGKPAPVCGCSLIILRIVWRPSVRNSRMLLTTIVPFLARRSPICTRRLPTTFGFLSRYVKEKLNAERNKRLRQGKGHMSKSELAKLRKILKKEARAKFVVDDGYVGSPENEKVDGDTHLVPLC